MLSWTVRTSTGIIGTGRNPCLALHDLRAKYKEKYAMELTQPEGIVTDLSSLGVAIDVQEGGHGLAEISLGGTRFVLTVGQLQVIQQKGFRVLQTIAARRSGGEAA